MSCHRHWHEMTVRTRTLPLLQTLAVQQRAPSQLFYHGAKLALPPNQEDQDDAKLFRDAEAKDNGRPPSSDGSSTVLGDRMTADAPPIAPPSRRNSLRWYTPMSTSATCSAAVAGVESRGGCWFPLSSLAHSPRPTITCTDRSALL